MNDRISQQPKLLQEVVTIDYAKRKRQIVILLLVCSALVGVVILFLPEEDTPLDRLLGLPYLMLGVMWCIADAAERDRRLGIPMKLALVFLFFLAFPIYLFRTRGFGAFKSLLLAFLLFVLMSMISVIVLCASYYFWAFIGF